MGKRLIILALIFTGAYYAFEGLQSFVMLYSRRGNEIFWRAFSLDSIIFDWGFIVWGTIFIYGVLRPTKYAMRFIRITSVLSITALLGQLLLSVSTLSQDHTTWDTIRNISSLISLSIAVVATVWVWKNPAIIIRDQPNTSGTVRSMARE